MERNLIYKVFDKEFLNSLSYQTPCYIYDTKLLTDNLNNAINACHSHFDNDAHIHYALKANDNIEVLSHIKQAGLGIDCVSGGEIEYAINCGFHAHQIVFAGVGKQDSEIKLALNAEIYAFNCESLEEVAVINELAQAQAKIANIMLRVNPDIDAKTHKHISTGTYANKFGITFDDLLNFLPSLNTLANIKLIGLHYHIGSQITDMNVFAKLGITASKHYKTLQDHGITLHDLDLGGGLGVDYINPMDNPITNFTDYFAILKANLNLPTPAKIHFELGRSLVAQCGVLLSQVLFIKNTAGTKFAIIDAGMNDLMRPALYEAKHKIINLSEAKTHDTYHIVGPVCESTDVFAKNLTLPELKRGDMVSILTSGAYGRVLASGYNRRPMIKEYMV
jgi:diaminopimelate decarboxylase